MGKLIERRADWTHVCSLPGGWIQFVRRIGPGSIWQCNCGKLWQATDITDDFGALRWKEHDDE